MVEGSGFENRRTGTTRGSNPFSSASLYGAKVDDIGSLGCKASAPVESNGRCRTSPSNPRVPFLVVACAMMARCVKRKSERHPCM